MRLALPDLPPNKGGDVMLELRVLGCGTVLTALALIALGSSVIFTVFPTSHRSCDATNGSRGCVAGLLVLCGMGLTIRNMWAAAPQTIPST